MKNPIELELENGKYICIDVDQVQKIEEYDNNSTFIVYTIVYEIYFCCVKGSYQQIFEYIANYERND